MALGKHVVADELEDGLNDLFEGFSSGFTEDSTAELKGSKICFEFVF